MVLVHEIEARYIPGSKKEPVLIIDLGGCIYLLKSHSLVSVFFSYIKSIRNEFVRNKKWMLSKQKYLKPGVYKLIILGKSIFFKGVSARPFFNKLVANPAKLYIKMILANLFVLEISGSNSNQEYRGDFILFTYAGDAKIFDLDRKIVLHFISDRKKYNNLKLVYNNLCGFFNIPVRELRDNEKLSVESYIDFKARPYWNEQEKKGAIIYYLTRLEHYLSYCVKDKKVRKISFNELWDLFPQELKRHQVMAHLHDFLFSHEITEWPQLLCHGDFSSKNVLLDKNTYYIIDWEFGNQFLFFFDFHNYMISEALYKNDYLIMTSYFNGEYDQYLERLFEIVGYQYIKGEKPFYLVLSNIQRMSTNFDLKSKQDSTAESLFS